MKLQDLFEDANQDIEMRLFISKLAHKIGNKIYNGLGHTFNVPLDNDEYFGYSSQKLGIDDVLPNFLLCLGLKSDVNFKGKYIKFRVPQSGFTQAIVVNCLSEKTKGATKIATGSTAFYETLRHELTHAFDFQRTNDKIGRTNHEFDDPPNPKQIKKYFNDSAEYNAYFHDIAGNLTDVARELVHCSSSKEAHEVLSLFGFDGNFKHDLYTLMTPGRITSQNFLKWLSDGNQRKLFKRLYVLHQEIMKRIATIDNRYK